MLRLLKFIGTFLGVTLLVYLLVIGLNRTGFQLLFENREAMADGSEWVEQTYSLEGLTYYIASHPETISVVSLNLSHPDSSVFLQPDTPRAQGILSNLFLFAAYADAFEQGEMNPDEEISWKEISQYELPQIGFYSHKETFESAQAQGLFRNGDSLRLEDALQLLPEFNSLALSDFLLMHLGHERMKELFDRLGIDNTDLPLPFSGMLLTLAPSIQNTSHSALLQNWGRAPREELEAAALSNSRTFSGGNQREEWLEKLSDDRLGLDFLQEREILALFPKTTAREMAEVMKSIHEREFITPTVSEQILQWLKFDERGSIGIHFSDYGALYDNRMGLLNGLDYGVAREDGTVKIQAVFFDQIHLAVWFHMSSNHMHQDFQQRLIWDPDLVRALKISVNRAETVSAKTDESFNSES